MRFMIPVLLEGNSGFCRQVFLTLSLEFGVARSPAAARLGKDLAQLDVFGRLGELERTSWRKHFIHTSNVEAQLVAQAQWNVDIILDQNGHPPTSSCTPQSTTLSATAAARSAQH